MSLHSVQSIDFGYELRARDTRQESGVSWSENDIESPRTMSVLRKWTLVFLVSSTTLCICCAGPLYTSTYPQIMAEFHCSRMVATIGLSLFIAGIGLGSMILSPLSEFFGRRWIYILSLIVYMVFTAVCAVAPNIGTLLFARLMTGLAGSAFSSVAGGTVGDLFTRDTLQAPMMVFTASPFLGASLGPAIGGAINHHRNWRWSFYVLLGWTFIHFVTICLFVPETYHPVLLRRKARRMRRDTGNERWWAPIEKSERSVPMTVLRSIYRPFLLLILEPMCFSLCLFSAILLGIQYLFFGEFGTYFREVHGFGVWRVGLTFLGKSVGMLAAAATAFWSNQFYLFLIRRREEQGGEPGVSEPEYRLPPAILGAPLVPLGLFWFGWTTYPSVHWMVPIIGSSFFGAGMIFVFSGIFTFLVDAYPVYAASALGANALTRSLFGAGFPLFGAAMYEKLGSHWATTILASLSLVMVPFPYIFFKYGARLRKKSRFASAS